MLLDLQYNALALYLLLLILNYIVLFYTIYVNIYFNSNKVKIYMFRVQMSIFFSIHLP